MTFKTENEAEAWGARMLKKHFPPKSSWHINVWDNLGWHVEFNHGKYVHVSWDECSKKFWCLLGSEDGGKCEWTPSITYRHKDPVKVVQNTLQFARQDLRGEIDRYNETAAGICREKLSLKGECV